MGDSSALCCSLFAFPHLTGSAQYPRGPPPRLDLHLEKSNPASLLQLFLNFKYKVNSTRSIQRVEFWEYFSLSAGFICMREAAHGGCKTEALWLNPLKYMWRKCYYMLMCVITRALWCDLETSGSVTSDGVNAVRLRRQHIRAPAGVYLSFSNVSV